MLLILAGVSISAITGNESAMEKAKEAKTASEKADELDTIKLAVVDAVAHGIDGYVHGEALGDALTGIISSDQITAIKANENGPWEITGSKGAYIITANGSVEKNSGISISPSSLKLVSGTTGELTASLFGDLVGETITWTASGGAQFNDGTTTASGVSSVTVKSLAGTITATAGGETASCAITVVGNVQSAAGLTSLTGMATKTLDLASKITNKADIEEITYSVDTTNTTTTGASVTAAGLVTLGNFTTGDSATVTVILTGVSSNLTKSVAITVTPVSGPKVGDFVDYTAGTWSQPEIDALNTAGLYAGASMTKTSYKFSGFAAGDSKDVSRKPTDTNNVASGLEQGWRVLKINDNGTIDIIHAGTPEGYYHPSVSNGAYKSQYILGGGINSNGTSAWTYDDLPVRDFNEYAKGTNAVANSGRLPTYAEMNAISTSSNLRTTGNAYWLPLANLNNSLWFVDYNGLMSDNYGILFGVRPVVSLQSDINWTSDDDTHTTYETRWMVGE